MTVFNGLVLTIYYKPKMNDYRITLKVTRLHFDGNLWLQLTIGQNGSLGINIHVPRFKSSLLLLHLIFHLILVVSSPIMSLINLIMIT